MEARGWRKEDKGWKEWMKVAEKVESYRYLLRKKEWGRHNITATAAIELEVLKRGMYSLNE